MGGTHGEGLAAGGGLVGDLVVLDRSRGVLPLGGEGGGGGVDDHQVGGRAGGHWGQRGGGGVRIRVMRAM